MSYEILYSIINYAVMPAWLLLAFLPKHAVTGKLVHSGLYPVVFGLFYLVLWVRALAFGESAEGGGFSTLETVMTAFTHPNVALMGWAHYLVFDLFVGAWIGRDAANRGVNHMMVVPCLIFAFLAGPIGLLMYLALRQVTGKGSIMSLSAMKLKIAKNG